jgi:hypothetical protein
MSICWTVKTPVRELKQFLPQGIQPGMLSRSHTWPASMRTMAGMERLTLDNQPVLLALLVCILTAHRRSWEARQVDGSVRLALPSVEMID